MLTKRKCCCGGFDALCCICLHAGPVLGQGLTTVPGPIDHQVNITLTLDAPFGGETVFTLETQSFHPENGCSYRSEEFEADDPLHPGTYQWAFLFNPTLKKYHLGLLYLDAPLLDVEYLVTSVSFNPLNADMNPDDSMLTHKPMTNAGVTTMTLTQATAGMRCYWQPQILGCRDIPVEGALIELIQSGSTFASGTTDETGFPSSPIEYTDKAGQSGVTFKVSADGYDDFTLGFHCGVTNNFPATITLAPSGCCQSIAVFGCDDIDVIEGAEISIYDEEGGTLLAQKTAGVGGLAILLWEGSCDVHVVITEPSGRLAYADDHTFTSGSASFLTMVPATGYQCMGCAYPVPDTLHTTHPVFGALTYTYSGGEWHATKVYSHPGYAGCSASTVTVTITYTPGGTYQEDWKSDGAGCPSDLGGDDNTAYWNITGGDCPPSFEETWEFTPGTAAEINLYQQTTKLTLAITE